MVKLTGGNPPASARQRFTFIDALRGLAAVGIALHHIDRYGPLSEPAATVLPEWLHQAMEYGTVGVPVFFVISGFVTAFTLRDTWITPATATSTVARRVIRLGLPYWALLLLVVAMDLFARQVAHIPSPIDEPPTGGQLLAHVLFLEKILGYDSISTGLWFICIEVQFCPLLVLMLGCAQRFTTRQNFAEGGGAFGLVIAFVPLALASLFVFSLNDAYAPWVIAYFGMLFIGIVAWWALQGRVPSGVFWAFVAACVLNLWFCWKAGTIDESFDGADAVLDMSVAIATGAAIYAVGRSGHLGDWLSARWLQYLGRISYSLFLIHYPVSHVVVNVGHYLTGDSPRAAVAWEIIALAASIAAAHFFYMLVEAPAARLAARLKRRAVLGGTPRA